MLPPMSPAKSTPPARSFPYKIAVLCDLRDADGRILLLHRAKDPNKGLYSPIGGKLDTHTGESPAMCAQREILEEAGVTVGIEDLHLGGMISEHGYGAGDGQTNWLLFWYRVTVPIALEPFEMREGRLDWHEPDELDRLPLPETDRTIIWPLVRAHEGDPRSGTAGFFAVHIDCTRDGRLDCRVEQSSAGLTAIP